MKKLITCVITVMTLIAGIMPARAATIDKISFASDADFSYEVNDGSNGWIFEVSTDGTVGKEYKAISTFQWNGWFDTSSSALVQQAQTNVRNSVWVSRSFVAKYAGTINVSEVSDATPSGMYFKLLKNDEQIFPSDGSDYVVSEGKHFLTGDNTINIEVKPGDKIRWCYFSPSNQSMWTRQKAQYTKVLLGITQETSSIQVVLGEYADLPYTVDTISVTGVEVIEPDIQVLATENEYIDVIEKKVYGKKIGSTVVSLLANGIYYDFLVEVIMPPSEAELLNVTFEKIGNAVTIKADIKKGEIGDEDSATVIAALVDNNGYVYDYQCIVCDLEETAQNINFEQVEILENFSGSIKLFVWNSIEEMHSLYRTDLAGGSYEV
jgi:hypothetical protein